MSPNTTPSAPTISAALALLWSWERWAASVTDDGLVLSGAIKLERRQGWRRRDGVRPAFRLSTRQIQRLVAAKMLDLARTVPSVRGTASKAGQPWPWNSASTASSRPIRRPMISAGRSTAPPSQGLVSRPRQRGRRFQHRGDGPARGHLRRDGRRRAPRGPSRPAVHRRPGEGGPAEVPRARAGRGARPSPGKATPRRKRRKGAKRSAARRSSEPPTWAVAIVVGSIALVVITGTSRSRASFLTSCLPFGDSDLLLRSA